MSQSSCWPTNHRCEGKPADSMSASTAMEAISARTHTGRIIVAQSWHVGLQAPVAMQAGAQHETSISISCLSVYLFPYLCHVRQGSRDISLFEGPVTPVCDRSNASSIKQMPTMSITLAQVFGRHRKLWYLQSSN